MPPKKSQEGDSEKLDRNTRRNKSKEKNSLEEVSTPVDARPQETFVDNIQDRPLPLIQETSS